MNIVFDLDNTLFHNDVSEIVSREFNVPLTSYYDLREYSDDAKKRCYEMFNDVDKMCNLIPFDGAYSKLKILYEQGHTLYCVTARTKKHEQGTLAMIKKHYPMISETILCDGFDKRDAYKQCNADMIIDDNFDFMVQGAEVGIKYLILISNEITKYNHQYVPLMNKVMNGHVFKSVADICFNDLESVESLKYFNNLIADLL